MILLCSYSAHFVLRDFVMHNCGNLSNFLFLQVFYKTAWQSISLEFIKQNNKNFNGILKRKFRMCLEKVDKILLKFMDKGNE